MYRPIDNNAMETKKKFEVVQIIPSTMFITYHVEAYDEDEAVQLVEDRDDSIELIGDYLEDDNHASADYDVNEIEN